MMFGAKNSVRIILSMSLLTLVGCAEGPLWKVGGYFPWVQRKWAAEEQIAETVHSRKQKLRNLARTASRMSETEKEQVVTQLGPFLQNEKIIQLRVDALYALGEINTQSAENLMIQSLTDSEAEVRIAAVNALTKRKTKTSEQEIIRVIGSDTDKDVRASAIRGLASYPGDAAVDTLAQVLNEPEPALQFAAMQSLDAVTGSDIGVNVTEWKKRLAQRSSGSNLTR